MNHTPTIELKKPPQIDDGRWAFVWTELRRLPGGANLDERFARRNVDHALWGYFLNRSDTADHNREERADYNARIEAIK